MIESTDAEVTNSPPVSKMLTEIPANDPGAVTVPLMSVGGLPVGLQVMGQQHEDGRMTSLARWLLESIAPVVAVDHGRPRRAAHARGDVVHRALLQNRPAEPIAKNRRSARRRTVGTTFDND